MTNTQDDFQRAYGNLDGRQYNHYLSLLPIPDLRVELETLDEPCFDGAPPPFGLPQNYRSDLAFKCLLRRQSENPINSSPRANEVKGDIIKDIFKVRHVASSLEPQELEYILRKSVAAKENTDDPDISYLQNLISVILSKAASSPTGSSQYE